MQLNVGGQLFSARRSALCDGRDRDNFFISLFSGRIGVVKDEQGHIFVNRSPDLFAPILDFLQTGCYVLRGFDEDCVRAEAAFYGVDFPKLKSDKTIKCKEKEYSLVVLQIAFGDSRNDGEVFVHGPLSGDDEGISQHCGGWNWADRCIRFAGASGWKIESSRCEESNRRKIAWLIFEASCNHRSALRKITWVLSRCS